MKRSRIQGPEPEPPEIVPEEAARRIIDLPVGPAEKALDALADRYGDALARQTVAGLAPIKIAAMLERGDFSLPAALAWFIAPDQAVAVLKAAPLLWRQVRDFRNQDHYRDIQDNALDFLTGLLLGDDDSPRLESLLDRIGREETSRHYLILPFVGWEIGPNQLIDFEDQEIDPGTVDHLFESIRWAAPDAAGAILDHLASADTPLPLFIFDLWTEALADFEQSRDYTALEEAMFPEWN